MPKAKENAVIAFIPAIHKGYIDFFKKYPGRLYVVGKDFIKDFPYIERDLRTPIFNDLKKIFTSLNLFDEIIELKKKDLKRISKNLQIVMPDDEITRGLAKKFFKGRKVKFENIFLRWNRQISTTEKKIDPDRVISKSKIDREFIKKSEQTALLSPDWWRRIGAIAVKNNKVLISTYNARQPSSFNLDSFGDPRSNFDAGQNFELVTSIHAESWLVGEAAKKGIKLDGASVYVSTFPCPVCAKLLTKAGIKKVYYSKGYSLLDAKSVLESAGVEIILVK